MNCSRVLLQGIAMALAVLPGEAALAQPRFVGSAKCEPCHTERYNGWRQGVHSNVVRPLEAEDWERVGDAKAPFPRESATHVIGNMHRLVFLTPANKHLHVLPAEFNLERRVWAPTSLDLWDPTGEGAGSGAARDVDWNLRCARCHTSGYDATTASYSEMGVGCESCHGAGSAHVETKGKERLHNPATMSASRGAHVCGQCHSHGVDKAGGKPFPTAYQPGDDLTETFDVAEPNKENTPLFWGNGFSRMHHAQYNEFRQSVHAEKGLRCFDCHQVHRARTIAPSKNTSLVGHTERFLLRRSAQLICNNCHAASDFATPTKGTAVDKHTHHPAVVAKRGPPIPSQPNGSVVQERLMCGDCHMPRVLRGTDGYAVRTHTFKVPDPKASLSFGAPNGCTQCHADKSPAWAVHQIDRWRETKKLHPPK